MTDSEDGSESDETTVEETEDGLRIATPDAIHEVREHHVVPRVPTMEVVTRPAADEDPDRTWVVGPANEEVRDRLSVDAGDVDTWVVTDPADVDDLTLAGTDTRVVAAASLDTNSLEASEFLDHPNVEEATVEWVERGDTFESGPGTFEVTSPDPFGKGEREYFGATDDSAGVSVDFVAGDTRVSYYARNARDVVDSYHRDSGVEPDYGVNDPRRDRLAGTDAETLQWDVDADLVGDAVESKDVLQVEDQAVDPEESSEVIDAEEHDPDVGGRGDDHDDEPSQSI